MTLRPWGLLVACAVLLGGGAVALIAGAGWFSLIGVLLTLPIGWLARQSLRLDDDGVRYRGVVPSESFELPWSELTQVVVDVVAVGAPGSSRTRKARARFLTPHSASRTAPLFSVADGQRVIDASRARGVEVLDERT